MLCSSSRAYDDLEADRCLLTCHQETKTFLSDVASFWILWPRLCRQAPFTVLRNVGLACGRGLCLNLVPAFAWAQSLSSATRGAHRGPLTWRWNLLYNGAMNVDS